MREKRLDKSRLTNARLCVYHRLMGATINGKALKKKGGRNDSPNNGGDGRVRGRGGDDGVGTVGGTDIWRRPGKHGRSRWWNYRARRWRLDDPRRCPADQRTLVCEHRRHNKVRFGHTDSVGSILYRGTKRSMQVPTIDGESRAVEVCQGFPEISVTQAGSSNAPGGGIKLRLDFGECVVRVDELTRTNIGVYAATGNESSGPTTLAWPTRRTVSAYPIAWMPSRTDSHGVPDFTRRPVSRRSRLIGSIEDSLQYDLTKVEINRVYRLSDPLEPVSFDAFCRTNSVWDEHIRWSTNECTGDQLVVAGQVRAWARGRFNAEVVTEGTSLKGDPRHTIYLRLEGTANGDVTKTCTFSPYAIRFLKATFAPTGIPFGVLGHLPISYGVRVDCRHTPFPTR